MDARDLERVRQCRDQGMAVHRALLLLSALSTSEPLRLILRARSGPTVPPGHEAPWWMRRYAHGDVIIDGANICTLSGSSLTAVWERTAGSPDHSNRMSKRLTRPSRRYQRWGPRL